MCFREAGEAGGGGSVDDSPVAFGVNPNKKSTRCRHCQSNTYTPSHQLKP